MSNTATGRRLLEAAKDGIALGDDGSASRHDGGDDGPSGVVSESDNDRLRILALMSTSGIPSMNGSFCFFVLGFCP